MLREGGISSLWRGNGINVLKIGPETALKFMAYEQVKRAIKSDERHELGLYERFCAGSIAGGISQSAIYPLEVSLCDLFLILLKVYLYLKTINRFDDITDTGRKLYTLERQT